MDVTDGGGALDADAAVRLRGVEEAGDDVAAHDARAHFLGWFVLPVTQFPAPDAGAQLVHAFGGWVAFVFADDGDVAVDFHVNG